MINHLEIELVITLTATPWDKSENGDYRRDWRGLQEPGEAARVEKVGSFWPFTKYTWSVWSPFSNDSVLDGEAASLELAMKAADDALTSLVAKAALE